MGRYPEEKENWPRRDAPRNPNFGVTAHEESVSAYHRSRFLYRVAYGTHKLKEQGQCNGSNRVIGSNLGQREGNYRAARRPA